MSAAGVHPDEILKALLDKGCRSDKADKLKKLHDLCAQEYGQRREGMRDFSVAHIARLAEEKGLFKVKTIYNKQSADYVALISSWGGHAGPLSLKQKKEVLVRDKYDFVWKIEDPAVRTLVQLALTQRDKLKTQLDLLKSQTNITVDMRPLGATIAKGSFVPLVEVSAQLTDSERITLEIAISPEFIRSQKWTIGESGEVRAENGRFLFDPGFVTAIRRILGHSAS